MLKEFNICSQGFNPFGKVLGLTFTSVKKGYSKCILKVSKKLYNPNHVLHGGVVYSMADTGMGTALNLYLNENEQCATIEIKIVYFAAVKSGLLECETKVIHKGQKVAVLESEVKNDGRLIAKALGSFSLFKKRQK